MNFVSVFLEGVTTNTTGSAVFGVFGASCGRIWMKIGGDQVDAFPDLPGPSYPA